MMFAVVLVIFVVVVWTLGHLVWVLSANPKFSGWDFTRIQRRFPEWCLARFQWFLACALVNFGGPSCAAIFFWGHSFFPWIIWRKWEGVFSEESCSGSGLRRKKHEKTNHKQLHSKTFHFLCSACEEETIQLASAIEAGRLPCCKTDNSNAAIVDCYILYYIHLYTLLRRTNRIRMVFLLSVATRLNTLNIF